MDRYLTSSSETYNWMSMISKITYNVDDLIYKYKARLVTTGYTQQLGIAIMDTYYS